jgi:hypothetical protein
MQGTLAVYVVLIVHQILRPKLCYFVFSSNIFNIARYRLLFAVHANDNIRVFSAGSNLIF